MALVVSFAGGIGSGKTSVSAAVATRLGWKRYGFGDYLRERIALSGGDPLSRQAMQDLGQSLVESDPEDFCRSVLVRGGFTAGDNFIVDGIRHAAIYRILERLAKPSVSRLLFLDVADSYRRERVAQRAVADDFARADGHRVESELPELPRLADAIIDGSLPFEQVIAATHAKISEWCRLG